MKNFENAFRCVEKERFTKTQNVSHCKRYSRFTNNKVSCIQCQDGYALNESTNSCITIASCTGRIIIGRQNEDYDFSIFNEKFLICDTGQSKTACAVEAVGNSKLFFFIIFRR